MSKVTSRNTFVGHAGWSVNKTTSVDLLAKVERLTLKTDVCFRQHP